MLLVAVCLLGYATDVSAFRLSSDNKPKSQKTPRATSVDDGLLALEKHIVKLDSKVKSKDASASTSTGTATPTRESCLLADSTFCPADSKCHAPQDCSKCQNSYRYDKKRFVCAPHAPAFVVDFCGHASKNQLNLKLEGRVEQLDF